MRVISLVFAEVEDVIKVDENKGEGAEEEAH
jgi:hypothetical protein